MRKFEQSKRLKQLPDQFFAKLAARVGEVVSKGHDVINLGQGNPDQPTPAHIVKSLQKAAENPLYHKYSPFRGHSFVKEAIANFYKREYNVEINPKTEVAVLFGGKAGLVEIPQCLLNPGDIALVPDPGYPDYWSGIAISEAKMEMMPLLKENHFLPDYDAISEDVLHKAKVMFLNYPNNPTGATATPTFFEDTVNLAKKNDICVVHDFAYGAIGFDGKKPISFLQTPGAKEVGIEIYTLSKTYNMAGWRVGFAIGNAEVIEAINRIQDHFYCSLFGAVQEAAATALNDSQKCVEELVQRYESRRNTIVKAAKQIGWNVTAPSGSFFAWFPVPDGYTSEAFFELLLNKVHVAVAPGIGFGNQGDRFVRVGLLSDEEKLLEAIDRIDTLKLF